MPNNPLQFGNQSPVLINNMAAKEANFFGVRDFHPLVTDITITSAQLKTLRATPITVCGAPGPGLGIDLQGAWLLLKYAGTNPFTGPQNLAFRYVGTAGVLASQAITGAGFLDQSASEHTNGLPKVDVIGTQAQIENQPLVLHNTGAAEITGNAANDNTLIIRVNYHVYATGF